MSQPLSPAETRPSAETAQALLILADGEVPPNIALAIAQLLRRVDELERQVAGLVEVLCQQ